MRKIDLEGFVVLLRLSGFPYDPHALEQLFEGYCRFQSMTGVFDRPSDPVSGLAVEFRPEPVSWPS